MVSTGIMVAVVNILYEYKEPAKQGYGIFLRESFIMSKIMLN